MKIIAGSLKGKNIKVPQTSAIEPTKEEVRNAIFSILGNRVKDANCLDLFAGSGSLGLEALSRGAASCTFVEGDKTAVEVIQQNIRNLKLETQSETVYDDVRHFLKKIQWSMVNDKWLITFLDPPYVTPIVHILKTLAGVLPKAGTVVYLCGRNNIVKVPNDLEVIGERCYGVTKLLILGRR